MLPERREQYASESMVHQRVRREFDFSNAYHHTYLNTSDVTTVQLRVERIPG